jgi:hypothetical protein
MGKWIYLMAIWNILRTFGIFYGQLVHFVFIWYIFPVLVSWNNKNLATLPAMAAANPGAAIFCRLPHHRSSKCRNLKCALVDIKMYI